MAVRLLLFGKTFSYDGKRISNRCKRSYIDLHNIMGIGRLLILQFMRCWKICESCNMAGRLMQKWERGYRFWLLLLLAR